MNQIENDHSSGAPTMIRNASQQGYNNVTSTLLSNSTTIGGTSTVTMTEVSTGNNDIDTVLNLTLSARPTVRWDETTVDNEGLGRKSSKRCCIFHKQREFGESSTDSSDEDDHKHDENDDDDTMQDSNSKGAAAKKRKNQSSSNNKVPDFQRFHA